MFKHSTKVLTSTVLLLGSASSYAATVSVADSYSLQRYNTGKIVLSTNEIIASDGVDVLPNYRGYVEFDLSSIAAGNHTFTLHLPDTGGMTYRGGISTTDIFAYSGDGVVDASDWGAGTVYLDSMVRPWKGGVTTIDITSYINDAILFGDSYFGLEFRSVFGQDAFGSGNTLPGTNLLHISYEVSAVPVPAAVWLFGSGLMCLVGIARRKKL